MTAILTRLRLTALVKYAQLWQDPRRRRADFHLFWPDKPYRETFSILIAGCGTSQAAKHAGRWPSARVTAIDFSATSVRYTEELKRKHNLTNLEIHQLAIEHASQLRTQTHTDTDLFLTVTAPEKRLFDAIDGQHSIGEICDRTQSSSRETASAFFEKLWWHDQIVIDASTSQ